MEMGIHNNRTNIYGEIEITGLIKLTDNPITGTIIVQD